MIYAIDEIIDDICVLEDINTGKIIHVKKSMLDKPKNGDIFEFKNNNYVRNDIIRDERIKEIKLKMDKLKD